MSERVRSQGFIQRIAAGGVVKTARQWETVLGEHSTSRAFKYTRLLPSETFRIRQVSIKKDASAAIRVKGEHADAIPGQGLSDFFDSFNILRTRDGIIDFGFYRGILNRREQNVTVLKPRRGRSKFRDQIGIWDALRVWGEARKARPSFSVRIKGYMLKMFEPSMVKAAQAVIAAVGAWDKIKPGDYTPSDGHEWIPVHVGKLKNRTRVDKLGKDFREPVFSFNGTKTDIDFWYSSHGRKEMYVKVTNNGTEGYRIMNEDGIDVVSPFRLEKVRRAAAKSKPVEAVQRRSVFV